MEKSVIESYKAARGNVFSRIRQWIGSVFDRPSVARRNIGARVYPTMTGSVPSTVAEEPFLLTEDMIVKELSGGKKIAFITLGVVASVGAGAVMYRKLNPPQKPEASWATNIDASPAQAVAAR